MNHTELYMQLMNAHLDQQLFLNTCTAHILAYSYDVELMFILFGTWTQSNILIPFSVFC
jgi:hypothetical protein